MKKHIFYSLPLALLLGFASCSLEYFPSDELNAEVLMADESGAEYILDGCYATLKDEIEYTGYASANTYVRHYFQLAEFPSDNICLSGKTEDPLYQATAYRMTDNLKNVSTLWYLGSRLSIWQIPSSRPWRTVLVRKAIN